MNTHDIALGNIMGAYKRREVLHSIFQEKCKQNGIEYGGRSWFTEFDTSNSVLTLDFGGRHETILPKNLKNGQYSSHSINTKYGVDDWLGASGNYKKYDKQVVKVIQETLHSYYDVLAKATDKYLLDKFYKYDFDGSDGFKKMIKLTDEILFNLNEEKGFTEEARKLLSKARKKFNNLIKNGKSGRPEFLLSMPQLIDIGTAILGRSTELCPIETGFLRSSGTLYEYNNYIRIIYECPYAIYVHENLEAVHPFGQAKFLETAAQEILSNRSVWVESGENTVYGEFYNFEWLKGQEGQRKDAFLVKRDRYGTVYIDIDRNLRVNYHHYME